ncbi:3-5 exonuclease [Xylanibacillus composti]|uniref:3-5 exonuclease n=2 Tax=Xylanibacillus composti TaxID=1572762 RepID=A0A8J4H259_9BACL|nr:3-5 exonuclease [Xylanibacillus composti]
MGGIAPAVASAFGAQNAQQMAFIRSVMKQKRNEPKFDTPLDDLQVVIFDLETTGFLHAGGDEIISIGAVKVTGRELDEEQSFYSLVNPNRPIPEDIQALTGITDEEAGQAPSLIDTLQKFMGFVERRILIAHGTGHDKQFLNAALWRTSRITLTHRVLDTILVAKWLNPNLSTYGLDELLDLYKIPVTIRHHALEDSLMTAKLWLCFLEEMRQRQVASLGDLYAHLSRH